ncbi:hypothetical protein EYD10_03363 [Varanus komodoensis]|uniref:Chromosome 3 open reading frame 38 n=1 Tax=Varanus komodoensis TaxID=61221 RepID=A0A8D2L8D6_VARKO|nr:uncharacterized protein C3orf38 homolog [Varanus komodoensis]KAF7250925.1 hypothetical protein EYD10_03363 [Varanus komodoensis]
MASAGAGMTERERDGCRELLELLQTNDLLALTDTVTNRLVQPDNRREAISAILLYSQSAEELLKRKKVFREIIFKYLATKGVVVPPSSEKHQLIDRAKQYWCDQLNNFASEQIYTKPNIQKPEEGGKQGGDKQDDDDQCHNLGEEFCQWFFRILNSQNPLTGQPQEEWGPQHFWDDAILKFCYNTSEQNIEEYFGAELVSLRLLSLVKEEYLFLNPNLNAGGLRCTVSRHGLVVVAVAGTVHRNTSCLGIFEQIFGLIRCPFRENTWRIKFMKLKILGQNALEPGTHIERPCIKYEPEELQEFYVSKELTLIEPQKF